MRDSQDYLPNAVLKVSAGLEDSYPVSVRLRTDQRMQQVWKTLAKEGRKRETSDPKDFETRLASLPDRYRMETSVPPDTCCVSNADRACVSFFLATTFVFSIGNRIVRVHDIEEKAQQWRTGARLCREARQSPYQVPTDPALATALLKAADYMEELAKYIETNGEIIPYRIEREAKSRAPGGGKGGQERGKPGNENIRGQVRDLAVTTRDIFGKVLYVPIAIAASVATNLRIFPKSVENWSSSLPPAPPINIVTLLGVSFFGDALRPTSRDLPIFAVARMR